MSKLHLFRSHSLIKIILLALLIPVIAVFSVGCGYKVYQAKIDDVEYSFKYRENDHIYQENNHINFPAPGAEINPLFPGGLYFESHINIKAEVESSNTSNSQRIDNFISSYNNIDNIYLKDFRVIERSVIEIDGLEAEYITYSYSYTAYTTFPVPYEGKFLAFKYKDVAFEVDILFGEGNSDTEEAFNLFVQTFEIK